MESENVKARAEAMHKELHQTVDRVFAANKDHRHPYRHLYSSTTTAFLLYKIAELQDEIEQLRNLNKQTSI